MPFIFHCKQFKLLGGTKWKNLDVPAHTCIAAFIALPTPECQAFLKCAKLLYFKVVSNLSATSYPPNIPIGLSLWLPTSVTDKHAKNRRDWVSFVTSKECQSFVWCECCHSNKERITVPSNINMALVPAMWVGTIVSLTRHWNMCGSFQGITCNGTMCKLWWPLLQNIRSCAVLIFAWRSIDTLN